MASTTKLKKEVKKSSSNPEKVSQPRDEHGKFLKQVKLNPSLQKNAHWLQFKDNIRYLASCIKAFQEVDCDKWLKNVNQFETDAEKFIKDANKGNIQELENQATQMVRDALKNKEQEIENLKNQLNNVLTMPKITNEFAKNNFYVYWNPSPGITVAWPTTLIIDKVFAGQYGKSMTNKYKKEGYLLGHFQKREGKFVSVSFEFFDREFQPVYTYHTNPDICLGDIKEEVLSMPLEDVKKVKVAFEKIMHMLRYINIDSVFQRWEQEDELKDLWEEAKKTLQTYFEERDPGRICESCGEVTNENYECIECGHTNEPDLSE
jgi:hypothetical protein